MKNRTKIILSCILSIVLCASLIAGGTYALFTNKSEVNIAVTSATVDIEAVPSNVKLYSAKADDAGTLLDENGYKYIQEVVSPSWTNGGTAALTTNNGAKLTLTNITPGDKVEFDISLLNKSNVKIQYRTVVMLKGENDEAISDLAKVLVISKNGLPLYSGNTDPANNIIYNSPEASMFYSAWSAVEAIPTNPAVGEEIDANPANDVQNIKMSVELPLTVGNSYQTKSCNIYFAVEAVQFNAKTVDTVSETFVKNDLEALNQALAASTENNNTMFEALTEAKSLFATGGALADLNGHLISKVNPDIQTVSSGFEFAWDSVNDRFLYMFGDNVIYPTENIPSKYQIFKVKENYSDTEGYSVYLQKDYSGDGELEITTGLDVGDNENISKITYARSATATPQSVIIRTNSFSTESVVNASKDTIYWYGKAGSLQIIECAMESLYLGDGCVIPFVEIAKGRIALEKGSKVEKLHFDATTQKDFDQIIVAADPSVTLPEFSRDEANIKETGTLVVELQKDTNNNEQTQSDYVWLYQQGLVQQIRISNNATSAGDTKATSQDVDEKTSKAASEIANNLKAGANYDSTQIDEGNVASDDIVETGLTENAKEDIKQDSMTEAIQSECDHEYDENNICIKCGYYSIPDPVGVAIHNQEELEAFANGTLGGLSDAGFQSYLANNIDLADSTHIVFNDETLSLTLDLYGHHIVGNWRGVRAKSGDSGQTEGLFNLKAGSLIVKDTIETGYIENLYCTTTADVKYDINTIGSEGLDTVVLFGTSQFELQSGSIINNQKYGSAILVHANNNVLTISGGLVKGDLFGVSDNGGTMIVKGGTIQGYTGVYRLAGNMTMTKGCIEGEYIGLKTNGYSVSNSAGYAKEYTYTISGGTIKGGTYSVYVSDNSGSYKYKEHTILKLSGGEYVSEGNYAISATNIDIKMQLAGGKYKAKKAVFAYIAEKNLWCNVSPGSDSHPYSWRTASNIEYLATKGFVFDETKTREENWEALKKTIVSYGNAYGVRKYDKTMYSDGYDYIAIYVSVQTVYDSFVVTGKTINQIETGLWSVQ